MSEGRFPSRRARVVGAVAVVLAVAGVVWFTTRGTGGPPPAVVPAGPPIEKGGVTYHPVRAADAPPGQVDGYGVHLSGATAAAAKKGKPVVVAGPNGGTIEFKAVEPVPAPPGEKK